MTTVPAIIVSKTAEDANRAAAGFLARYGGPTRRAYGTDLRAWFGWCRGRRLEVLEVRRPHVELWVRAMEEQQHLSSSTVSRRLSTVAGYYRFAVIDGYIDRTPTEFVRRPHRDTESTTLGLDGMELGAFIAQGAAAGVTDHALACLLGLLGLRIADRFWNEHNFVFRKADGLYYHGKGATPNSLGCRTNIAYQSCCAIWPAGRNGVAAVGLCP